MITPIAKMVREMIAKGVDVDIIELAVTTAEQTAVPMSGGSPVDIAAEKRRAYDRDRKKRIRGIPPESTGIPPDTENPPLSNQDKKEEVKKERGERKVVSRGHRLPDDWAPSSEDWQSTLAKLGSQIAALELAKFRDYWPAQPGAKGVKLDWNGTFRNWIRNARPLQNGNANIQSKNHSLIDAIDRQLAALEAEDSDDLALPESPIRLISG